MSKIDAPVDVAQARDEVAAGWNRVVGRRSFLVGVGAVGVALPATALMAAPVEAESRDLTSGDIAILRFLAAAEIIESDLWIQYNELGGAEAFGMIDGLAAPVGVNSDFISKLQLIDGDMPQYISDNTQDEISHAEFLNAYLRSKGAAAVNLDAFRTLAPSRASGVLQKPRLTNLKHLDVDTSWYRRYRSAENPDLGASFGQVVDITNKPAIPTDDAQGGRMQAIANTAAFHFTFIEQGGSSLYTTLAQKASNLEVLRIVLAIGGVEVDHFSLWHDKVGNTVSQPLAPLMQGGISFPDLNNPATELSQTNKILPEPTDFLPGLPEVSIIRPSTIRNSGAVAAVAAFSQDGLFKGQPESFFDKLMELARAADAATRRL